MIWKVCIKDYFMNCELIFPTQQKDVAELINIIRGDDNIKKVIIFGSSITSACNPWSDIDVYLEKVYPRPVSSYPDTMISFDTWDNFTVDSALLEEIINKGVLVYERQ